LAERKRLGPGIYEQGDELHVDLEELVAAAGGDPTSDEDRAKAIEELRKVGIPVEVRSK
jgi:gluconate kinase